MHATDPRAPVTGTSPGAGSPAQGTRMSLENQARDIIQEVLDETSPQYAPARDRLRDLLSRYPDDHIAVLREHLIITRELPRPA